MTRLSYDPLRPIAQDMMKEAFSGPIHRVVFRWLIAILIFAITGFVAFRSDQTGDMRPFFMVIAVYWIYIIFALVVTIRNRLRAKEAEDEFSIDNEEPSMPESPIEEPGGLADFLKWHDRLFARISESRVQLLVWRLVAIVVGWAALIAVGFLAFSMKDIAYFGWGALAVGLSAALAHKVLEFRTSELAHLDRVTAKRRMKMGRIANFSILFIFGAVFVVGIRSHMSLWLFLVPVIMMSLFQIVPVALHFLVTRPDNQISG